MCGTRIKMAEEIDVNILEFSLDEEEINNWISKLEELKETKSSITLEIDEEDELQINYGEEE